MKEHFIKSNHKNNIEYLGFDKLVNEDYAEWLLEEVDHYYNNTNVLPDKKDVFNVYKNDWRNTKVIILSQDPYFRKGIADGLAFSTKQKITPPSLEVIFDEIQRTDRFRRSNNNLTDWSNQGVLLLNTSLTVQEGKALSHSELGWDTFVTNSLLSLYKYLHSNNKEYPIILAWGKPAKEFTSNFVDKLYELELDTLEEGKQIVLETNHPVAQKRNKNIRFVGCNHFNLVNSFLEERNLEPIDWLGSDYIKSLFHCLYTNVSDYKYGNKLEDRYNNIEMNIHDIDYNDVVQSPSKYRLSDVLTTLMFGKLFNNKSNKLFYFNLDEIIIKEIDDAKREFYKSIKKEAEKLKIDKLPCDNEKVVQFIINKIKYIYIHELD